jgi:hypothetical protein
MPLLDRLGVSVMNDAAGAMWAFLVIGGPILLGLVLFGAWLRNRRQHGTGRLYYGTSARHFPTCSPIGYAVRGESLRRPPPAPFDRLTICLDRVQCAGRPGVALV